MKNGFLKAASASPEIKLANPPSNAEEIIKIINKAHSSGIELLVFPEMCISGYTCGELFLSDSLIKESIAAIQKISLSLKNKEMLVFIGAPMLFNGKLYSCAVSLQGGNILGIVPKTAIPGYGEFYEPRHFSSGKGIDGKIIIDGKEIPFSADLIFKDAENESIKIAAEICEDLFIPDPPSIKHAKAGASIIVNLSASNEVIGKSSYRKTLIKAQSGRLSCAYIYASAGKGESVSDLIFSAHRIIAENGVILAEGKLFESGITVMDIDIQRLMFERRRLNVFETEICAHKMIDVHFSENPKMVLDRKFSQTPFVPDRKEIISQRAEIILQMQSRALADRLERTKTEAVIGVSGGLDSCLALLVIVRSYEILKRDRRGIIAVTMPGPGTSVKTLSNVSKLAEALEIKIDEIPILDAVERHLKDIKHSGNKDIVYENAQARERSQILMDLANDRGGIVVGTGDLSEIALGWNTYNGDHISMYGVNASIPKTLVKYLVSNEAQRVEKYREVLNDILNTEISPELLPAKNGSISQKTEDIIGRYILHDFFLYYFVRFGKNPKDIFFLAQEAFKGVFPKSQIEKTLQIFINRFFKNQFKRNCFPDGIKVGTISLSPRGDWRMPSEACEDIWQL